MKKILPLILSIFLIAIFITALNSPREVAGDKKVFAEENLPGGPPCPPPTVTMGNQCVLEDDVVLEETLELFSDIKLNCQGHKITPAVEGILGDVNSRSQPELGIFLNGVQNIQIQECVIEGFDHGILAINGKLPEELKDDPGALAQLRNKIQNNKIKARFVPLHLAHVDNFDLKVNNLTWLTRGGAGILIHYDSDMIDIKNNIITGDFAASTQGAFLFPGPTATEPAGPPITPTTLNSNPVFNSGHGAILILQVLAPHPQLFNAIIEGIPFPFQLKTTESPVPDEDFTADILAEGNVITFPQGTVTEDGITLSNTLRIIVRNNIVGSETDGGHRQSIRAGAITGPPPNGAQRQFPGNCTLNSSRDCLSDFDCNIPDIDSVSQGTCTLPPTQPVFWTSLNSVIENNTIFGPFNQGIATTGENFTIQGNNIIGPIRPGGAGISLGGKGPLETAVVVRNTMSGVSTVFSLGKVFSGISASFFGVKINFNDFTGYTTAIRTSNDYDLPSELSVDGKGNYWDLDNCTLGGFDETKVVPLNPSVVDSNPYGEEVGVIVTDSRPCDMDSKSCNGNPAIGCDTDANCIAYTYRADPPPPLTCPEQGF